MELSLDSTPAFIPKTISRFLHQLAAIKDGSLRSSELDGYVKRLEDEQRKIEVFKRELPLCMLLLNDAIERLKEEVMQEDRPEMEDFMPLKGKFGENGGVVSGKENNDKKNWMSSAQLWSTGINLFDYSKHDSVELKLTNGEDDPSVPIVPLKGQLESGLTRKCVKEDNKENSQVPNLSLMTPLMSEVFGASASANTNSNNGCRGGGSGSGLVGQVIRSQNKPQQQQQHQQGLRKQRRCWSPDLHRRFIDALQQLGGIQVATPKQIRELMQVEGLTNDEVKSHLQKYRLHVRKVPSSSDTRTNSLWMPLDHSGDNSKANKSQSGSPQGPLLLAGRFGKGRSPTGGESGDSREAEDDEKSDGQSWKGGLQNHQGGNA